MIHTTELALQAFDSALPMGCSTRTLQGLTSPGGTSGCTTRQCSTTMTRSLSSRAGACAIAHCRVAVAGHAHTDTHAHSRACTHTPFAHARVHARSSDCINSDCTENIVVERMILSGCPRRCLFLPPLHPLSSRPSAPSAPFLPCSLSRLGAAELPDVHYID